MTKQILLKNNTLLENENESEFILHSKEYAINGIKLIFKNDSYAIGIFLPKKDGYKMKRGEKYNLKLT